MSKRIEKLEKNRKSLIEDADNYDECYDYLTGSIEERELAEKEEKEKIKMFKEWLKHSKRWEDYYNCLKKLDEIFEKDALHTQGENK